MRRFLLLLLFPFIHAMKQREESVAYALHRDLLNGYRRTTRPVAHPEVPIEVTAYPALYQIIHLDQARNTITLAGSFELYWQDVYLQWDPDLYHQTTHVYLDSDEIWIPEISLYYSHHHQNTEVVLRTNNNARVNSSGHISYYIPFTTESLCPTNVKNFPFDTQKCSLFFGSWAHNNESILFSVRNDSTLIDVRDYYDNQEWELLEAKMEAIIWFYADYIPPQTWSVLELSVAVRRTSFYYVFNLVIPSTIITIVAVVGFHMPSTSGRVRDAKFRLGIITLMSMSVILLAVVEDMPKFGMRASEGKRGSSSGVPLIGIFYFSLLVLIGLSTITTSFFVLLEREGRVHGTMPWFLRWLALGHHWALLRFEPQFPDEGPLEEEDSKPLRRRLSVGDYDNLVLFHYFHSVLEELASSIGSIETALGGIRHELLSLLPKDDIENQWAIVIRRLELISLAIYMAFIFIILFLFFFHEWWYGV